MNFKKIFNKEQVLTIPNSLCLIRILLIPVIVWLYCGLKNNLFCFLIVVISGFLDILDGKIARRYNMISEIGKFLDPISDKLTQFAIAICLCSRYKLMFALVGVFVIKEFVMFMVGLNAARHDSINGAKWHGKLTTAMLYIMAMVLLVFENVDSLVSNILIVVTLIMMIISLTLYINFYFKLNKEFKAKESLQIK